MTQEHDRKSPERNGHEVVKTGIDDMPLEIHDMIVSEVATMSRKRMVNLKNLRACSLTTRRWRHRAQSAIHRDVVLTQDNHRDLLRRYITSPGPEDRVCADLSQFPQSLTLVRCDYPSMYREAYKEFHEFVKKCRQRITYLRLDGSVFAEAWKLIEVIELLHELTTLEVQDCYWSKARTKYRPRTLPRPSFHLERLVVVRNERTSYPLRRWLSEAPQLGLTRLAWECDMARKHSIEAARSLFRSIAGPSLTTLECYLIFSNDLVQEDHPDPSNIPSLVSLVVHLHFDPDCVIPAVFRSIFLLVNAPNLEKITVHLWAHNIIDIYFDQGDIVAFKRSILRSGALPRLKTINFHVHLFSHSKTTGNMPWTFHILLNCIKSYLSGLEESNIDFSVDGRIAYCPNHAPELEE